MRDTHQKDQVPSSFSAKTALDRTIQMLRLAGLELQKRLPRRERRSRARAVAKTPVRQLTEGQHARFQKFGHIHVPGRVHAEVKDAVMLRTRTIGCAYLAAELLNLLREHGRPEPQVLGRPFHTAFDHPIPTTEEEMKRFAIAMGDQAFEGAMALARMNGAFDDLTDAQAIDCFARVELSAGDPAMVPPAKAFDA